MVRERDNKKRLLGESNALGTFVVHPRFMQDRRSKDYNLTIDYINHKTVRTLGWGRAATPGPTGAHTE